VSKMEARQIPIVCPGHSRPLAEVQYSPATPDGVFLISACLDKMPMLRRGETGDWIGTFQGHKGAVWSAKLDKQATKAATGAADFSAKLWDAITGQEKMQFTHRHIVKTVEFSPDGRRLLTGSSDKTVKLHDLEAGTDDAAVEFKHPDGVRKALWGNDENTFITGGQDGAVRVWDVRSQQQTQEIMCSDLVMDMELSANGDILTVAAGKEVKFFDAKNGFKELHTHKMPDTCGFKEEGGASLHPSGKKFIAGGLDLWVRVFDFETGEMQECHKGHHGPVRCLRYAPDGKSFASGSEDGTIRIWQTSTEGATAVAGAGASSEATKEA